MTVQATALQLSYPPVRGALAGFSYGLVVGGVAGTWAFPFVGTLVWAVAGAVLGAVVGTMTACALQALKGLTTTRWSMRVVGGSVAAALSGVVASVLARSGTGLSSPAVLVLLAAGLGASLAPWIADQDGEVMAPLMVETGKRLVLAGAALGVTLGAVAGLVIGLVSYPPTSPVAMVEGAVFGAATGVVLAVMLSLALLGVKALRH